jgi:hypothetical protein
MATPSSPQSHGVAIVYGTNTYAGLYVTDFDAESGFENKDTAADEDGVTKTVRYSSGTVGVTINGLIKETGFSALQPGSKISYDCGEVAGNLSNILVDSVTVRGQQKGWRSVSIRGTAYESIS